MARTPTSLQRQAEDVAWWGEEARDDLGKTVLEGVRLDVEALVAEIERHNGKLAGALGSHEEAVLHLEAVRNRARKVSMTLRHLSAVISVGRCESLAR